MYNLGRITVVILVISMFYNIPIAETSSVSYPTPELDAYDIAYDGVISTNEYYTTLNLGANFKLHYMLNNSIIYMAMESAVTGYVSIGLGGDGMNGADIYIGYYDTQPHFQDNFGKSSVAHSKDAIQNVIGFGGSDDGTTTIMEFSRYLDTGDAAEDFVIPLDTDIASTYAIHDTNDDFTSTHTARARVTINFASYIPSEPLNLAGSPDDSKSKLTWDPPYSDGGQAISYTVYRSDTSGSGYSQVGTTTQNNYDDTTVTNGQTYYYVITTTNAKGESTYSNEIAVTPSGQIGTPQNIAGSVGDGYAYLSWTPPATDGGSPITGYNVYRSDTSGGELTMVGTTSSLNYNDTTVTNGFTYYYVLTAFNALSEGVQSSETSLSPIGKPTVVLQLRGFADSSSVTLNWNEPLSLGGYPFVKYNVYRKLISETNFVFIGSNTTAVTATEYYDTAVVNQEIYDYYVTVENSFGESDPSDQFQIVVAQVPYQITDIAIQPSYLNLSLSWTAPFDNGFTITKYSIFRSENSSLIDELFIANTTELFYNDLSVDNGIEYYYRILAINSQGAGPLSQAVSSIAGVIPDTPLNFKGSVLDKSILLQWQVPDSDGGSPILSYRIYRSDANTTEAKVFDEFELNFTDTGLTNGVEYDYAIVAVNSLGESNRVLLTMKPGVVPDRPDTPSLTLFEEYVLLEFSDPNDGGYEITQFNVYRTSKSGVNYAYLGSDRNSFSDVNLIKGATFFYAIAAVNALGESLYSFEANITIPFDPSPPRNLASLAGDKVVALSWGTPLSGATDIIQYNIYRSSNVTNTFEKVGNSTELNFVDFNVTNGIVYYYYVVGLTNLGEGPKSNTVTAIPQVVVTTVNTNSTTIDGNNTETWIERNSELVLTISLFLSFGMIGSTFLILRKFKN